MALSANATGGVPGNPVCEPPAKADYSGMITTATLPDNFQLREGEEFDFHAVAVNGGLVVTRVIRSQPAPPEDQPGRPAHAPGFAAKWGRSMAKVENQNDTLLTHINEKHVK